MVSLNLSNHSEGSLIMAVIYLAQNCINFKKYVGLTTKSLSRRIFEHTQQSRNPKFVFHHAIKKYGIENFIWYTITECPDEDRGALETFFIEQFETHVDQGMGYNCTSGGDGVYGVPEASNQSRIRKNKAKQFKIRLDKLIDRNIMGFQVTHPDGYLEYIYDSVKFARIHKIPHNYFLRIGENTLSHFKYYVVDNIYIDPKTGRLFIKDRDISKTNKRNKLYEIIHPNGFISQTRFLPKFCRDHSLPRALFTQCASTSIKYSNRTQCRGYMIKIVEENPQSFIDSSEIRNLYQDQLKSLSEIAEELKTTAYEIRKNLALSQIELRVDLLGFAGKSSKSDLIQLYFTENLNTTEIGKVYKRSGDTVCRWLMDYGLNLKCWKNKWGCTPTKATLENIFRTPKSRKDHYRTLEKAGYTFNPISPIIQKAL